MFQVEFDASVKEGHSYLGFVLNNNFGDSVHEETILLRNETSSVRAELFAAFLAINYCAVNEFKQLKVFGDCSEAIRFLTEIRKGTFQNKKVLSMAEKRYIAARIKQFEDIKFYYLSRESNWVAHSLVENGVYDESKSWKRVFPDFPTRVESGD